MQTGFCSPSRMRSFGATPFERCSLNWSVTYCKGFCLVANVAVSDMASLLVVGISREGVSILLHPWPRSKPPNRAPARHFRQRHSGPNLLGAAAFIRAYRTRRLLARVPREVIYISVGFAKCK